MHFHHSRTLAGLSVIDIFLLYTGYCISPIIYFSEVDYSSSSTAQQFLGCFVKC